MFRATPDLPRREAAFARSPRLTPPRATGGSLAAQAVADADGLAG